mmetsp:Transcript_801/g.1535  ORF Transcript_801/g.1535 Transcript_801/m.1535 type:complete len:86 (-) Transcript_801:76-333(-)
MNPAVTTRALTLESGILHSIGSDDSLDCKVAAAGGTFCRGCASELDSAPAAQAEPFSGADIETKIMPAFDKVKGDCGDSSPTSEE